MDSSDTKCYLNSLSSLPPSNIYQAMNKATTMMKQIFVIFTFSDKVISHSHGVKWDSWINKIKNTNLQQKYKIIFN